MGESIRVVIADDHLMVRKGLRLMLAEADDIRLVGDAADGAAAVAMVAEQQPDVVLMDVRMPGMDGIEALATIRQRWPQIAVVIVTTYDEDDSLLRGLRAGACGYVVKDTPLDILLATIRAAARGDVSLPPSLLARILAHTPPPPAIVPRSSPPSRLTVYGELTKREQEILAGVARGERSKEIAAHLGITERTVRAYLTSIYTKLNVDSRAAAVAVALEQGILLPHTRG